MSERIVIITDLHGCYDECVSLLEKLRFDKARDTLVNLGDTIDRGPKIYEVFEFLRGLKEEMGDRCILLRGNHEQMMLDATGPERTSREKKHWYINSGEKTVYAFINHKHRIQEFREWYLDMPFYWEDPRFTCVHASLTDEDPAKNTIETMIWGRTTEYQGKLIMTGHTPYKTALYIKGDGSFGYLEDDHRYNLEPTGMMALDTGCVFGNRLTGIVVEEDTFYVASVPSTVVRS